MMETADRRAIVNGYGCGGEGGGGGRFVSWLCAKIHPPKEGVSMVIMVDDGSEKNNKCVGSVVRASLRPLLPPWLISKKRQRLFSALELPPNHISNFLFRN